MPTPRPGPCSPWVSGPEIETLPWLVAAAGKATAAELLGEGQLQSICAEAAAAASEVLYELSGRIFTGECGPITIRPLSRPTDLDTRALGATVGWSSYGSAASSYGFSNPGVASHYLSVEPPTIELPYPVTSIVQVKIDGTVIPPNEYEMRSYRHLVRIRPTASFNPTEMYGWPTSQIMDLPDTEEGTFSVTLRYGTPPPAAGLLAARKLAEYLALPQLGDDTHYPRRVTQMTRQGVTAKVTDVIDILASKSLGIYEVDTFLLSVNPNKNRRQAAVFSPDVGRPRRQATPSLPS